MSFGKLPALLLVAGITASAQHLSVGIIGGVPLTDGISSSTSLDGLTRDFSSSKLYTIGGMVEVRLPLHLAIEVDALYRPISLDVNEQLGSTLFKFPATSLSNWEFPVLAKYRFPFPLVKPFVEAGPSFRKTAHELKFFSNYGLTLGGGVELKLLKLRIAPALRYTHWGSDGPFCPISNGFTSCSPSFPPSNRNQAELLVGISF